MNTKLHSEQYNSAIKIYYQDDLPHKLAEKIIECVWINPDQLKQEEDFKLIQETKARVFRMKLGNQTYYLKCYAYRNSSKVIKNMLRPVDALKCFKIGMRLLHADIATAKPVLALTMRRNAWLVDSIFVTPEVPGMDLYTYLSNNSSDPKLRTTLIKKIAVIWSKLVNHSLVHLDPWLGNFMIYPQENDLQLELIDIDNIYSLPYLPQKLLVMKNLSKLKGKQANSFAATQAEIDLFLEEFRPRCNACQDSPYFQLALSRFIKKSN